jgi:hypothetical protein
VETARCEVVTGQKESDMKEFAVVSLLALSGGACGGGGTPSSGPDAGSGQVAPRVAVVTGQAPALIAFRGEASTGWQTPDHPSAGRYEFEVNGPYRVIVVCDHRAGAAVVEYARTLDDARVIDNQCGMARTFPLHVRGQMMQTGEVFFGGAGRGQSNAPWSFDLPAEAGTFDFVAFFGPLDGNFDQVSIRRDVALTGDLDLGPIDVAHENANALVPMRFTAANLAADEELSADVLLMSGNTIADRFVFGHPDGAWLVNLVPDAALRAADSQHVTLSTASSSDGVQQRARSISREVHEGGPTSLTLMDAMGTTTFDRGADRLAVTWTAPAADEIDVSRVSFSDDFSRFVIHDLVMSRAFLAGTTSATLDFTDVPGFLPAWGHDPALEQVVAVDAIIGAFPEDSLSEVSMDIPAPAPAGIAAGGAARGATPAAVQRARRARSAGLR